MLNYPYVQNKNIETKYGDKNKLGTILECKEENKPTFILLYINAGNYRPDVNPIYVSYESIEKCMKLVNILYKGKNIATTVIGSSRFDGNGDKDTILKILEENSNNINLTIYDYVQKSRDEELKEIRLKELELKKKDINAYYEAADGCLNWIDQDKKRKQEADERFKNNGHARY